MSYPSKKIKSTPTYYSQGGLLHLAHAFFDSYQSRIICLDCEVAGYIKDQGGRKGPGGEPRRLFRCRRSNGQGATEACGKVTCEGYIALATLQLTDPELQTTFEKVIESVICSDEDRITLTAYWNKKRPEPQQIRVVLPPSPKSSSPLRLMKRKATEEANRSPTREDYSSSSSSSRASSPSPCPIPSLDLPQRIERILLATLDSIRREFEVPSPLVDQKSTTTTLIDQKSTISILDQETTTLVNQFIKTNSKSIRSDIRNQAKRGGIYLRFQKALKNHYHDISSSNRLC